METIFLIKDNPSGYEETPSVIGFTMTKDEADIVIAKESKNYVTAQIIVTNLQRQRDFFVEGLGEWIGEDRKEIPKWCNGIAQKDITQAMRDERNNIKAENEAIAKRNQDSFAERSAIICQYLKEQLDKEIVGYEESKKYISFNTHFGSVNISEYLYDDKPFLIEEVKRII